MRQRVPVVLLGWRALMNGGLPARDGRRGTPAALTLTCLAVHHSGHSRPTGYFDTYLKMLRSPSLT
ncbi:putative gp61 [Burkholderia pseudomallei MSHR5609]|nr:putative gp61 [Burkholderia pseudomallei MSHR5609]